ncbi:hypothetical protein [Rheinheimera sp.]|uniref:hypothetical protein n=1 Tax=Rheinheimera sp. TaxID=1869214 RepID=UPI003D27CBAE
MAKWGLLQGAGRGISQGAAMMQQGMAEDREVERQRLREASAAARWAKQEERENARYKSEQEYRQGRDKAADDRFNKQDAAQSAAAKQAQTNAERSFNLQERQLSAQEEARRVQRIEETLSRIQSKYSREGEQIDRKYDRLLDKAEPEDKAALYEQRDREHEALSTKLSGEMLPALKSFGDGLKGTSFASYIDVLAEMNKPKQEAQPTQSGTTVPAGFDRNAAVKGLLMQPGAQPAPTAPGNPMPTPGLLKPGFSSGIQSGMSGYNSPAMIDDSSITPLQQLTTAAGRAVVGTKTGLLMDGLEYLNNNAIQPAWAWANTPNNQGRK